MTVSIKRVYEKAAADDGFRVLVDRLWPRGISKQRAEVDDWVKEIGPTDDLRTWFAHVPDRFGDFAKRYRAELDTNAAVDTLRRYIADHDQVTLVYSAKDTEHNQAVVLRDYLAGSSPPAGPPRRVQSGPT